VIHDRERKCGKKTAIESGRKKCCLPRTLKKGAGESKEREREKSAPAPAGRVYRSRHADDRNEGFLSEKGDA